MVGALFSVKVLEPFEDSSTGVVVVSPPNEAVGSRSRPARSVVTGHDATPAAFVVPVQDCVPFTVRVTDSFGTGWLV